MNLLQHRRCLLLGGEKGLIPQGYTQVTGLMPDPSNPTFMRLETSKPFTVQIDVTIISFSARSGPYPVIYGRDGNLQLGLSQNRAFVGNAVSSSQFFTVGGRYILEGVFSSVASESRYLVDGVDTGLRRASGSSDFYLLGAGFGYIPYAAVHSVKFYKDGILIKDLLPCKRDADDVYGFHDIVNSEFLASSFVEYTT